MLIKSPNEVKQVPVTLEGAADVKVQVFLGPGDKAPTMALRIFELGPGGHTPYHDHPFEHEVMILDGDIMTRSPDGDTPVSPGEVLLIMPGERHQFRNRSATSTARFMCLVPIAYQT